jgi:polyhydroxyalkanoate synthesis repressor PhaR
MTTTRIIKKYSNRRLYDTAISQYITLEEVKELVVKKIKFRIIDNKTEEDMTNYVLLQIITEGENGSKPIFTTEILQNIIRFYNNPMQQAASDFIDKSFAMFNGVQTPDFLQKNPVIDAMKDFAKRNMAMWDTVTPKEKTSTESTPKPRKPRKKPSQI